MKFSACLIGLGSEGGCCPRRGVAFRSTTHRAERKGEREGERDMWCIPDVGETNNSNLQVVGGTTQKDLLFGGGLLWWHGDQAMW